MTKTEKQKVFRGLEGQVAVVTGANSGIGESISMALAKMGVSLLLLGRNSERLTRIREAAKQKTRFVETYSVDLTKNEDISCFAEMLQSIFNALDILIHSAGVIMLGGLESARVSDFDRQYQVNVRAPFLLTQKLMPMLRAGKGQIVFINSTAGLKPGRNNGLYAATKSALKSLADSFRNELNADGIRVLSVYPGRTATPMQKDLLGFADYQSAHLMKPEDVTDAVINALVLPKSAEITDITIRPLSKVI